MRRRAVALVAALLLVGALAGSSAAVTPPARSSFVGSFDFYLGGTRIGHIDALLVPTADQPFSGYYRSNGPYGSSVAVPNDVVFHHFDSYNEVWFNGLEVAVGGGYAAFTGHIVDNFNPAVPDTFEVWGKGIGVTGPGAFTFTNTYSFTFTVGSGLFALTVK